MNNREKKPPVNINDLKKAQEVEEHEKGPLNYMGEKNNPEGGSATKSKVNLTQLILAIGISVLVFFLIAQFTLTSKSDSMVLLDNQKLLESSQAATEVKLNTETGRVENIIAAQANFAQKSELAGFNSALESLKTLVTGYGNSITSLESISDDHEDRITDLEAAINGTSTVVGGSLDYYFTAITGGYALTVRSSREGIYVARVTLVYEEPYAIGEEGDYIDLALWYFHQSVSNSDSRVFVPELILSGTGQWKVASISFYTKDFSLKAREEISKRIRFWVPNWNYMAYVEVLPGGAVAPEDKEEI